MKRLQRKVCEVVVSGRRLLGQRENWKKGCNCTPTVKLGRAVTHTAMQLSKWVMGRSRTWKMSYSSCWRESQKLQFIRNKICGPLISVNGVSVWISSKQACPCLLKLWECSYESLCFSCVRDELWRHFTGKGDSWQFFWREFFYLLLDSDRWRAKQEVGRGTCVTCNREPAWIELTTFASTKLCGMHCNH